MTQAHGVEQAFLSLEDAPPVLQGLLRPVLVRALQDPTLMRRLGSAALSQHLTVLGQVLMNVPAERSGSLAPLQTFLHLALGQDVEDVEEAYRFTENLDGALRARVEGGLSRVLQFAADRSGQGTLSLLALARLLALAFSNLPLVEHLLGGGAIEPFLPSAGAKKAPAKGRSKRAAPTTAEPTGSESRRRREHTVSAELASFVGELVEVVVVVSEHEGGEAGHVLVTMGRVLEMSPGHVLIETLRHDERRGSRLLLSLTHIVAMRTLPSDFASRASNAG